MRHPYPNYRVPLEHAHRLWKSRRTPSDIHRALELLEDALKHFQHAAPLLEEYALLLAEAGQHERALKLLGPLQDLCQVFRDEEMLSPIGPACKDLGDRVLEADPVPVSELQAHPACQWYAAAYERYKQPFEIRKHYYPGINAATLALLVGQADDARRLAEEVSALCRAQDVAGLGPEDRFWVLVTQGEAAVLLGKGNEAATCYRQALSFLPTDGTGMAQSAYDQVCRLCWAFGGSQHVGSVLSAFRQKSLALKPGPLGNCQPGKIPTGAAKGDQPNPASRRNKTTSARRPTC